MKPGRIAIVSTMSGSSWGGSEELWVQVARLALDRGYEVLFSVLHWPDPRPALEQLERHGARRHERRRGRWRRFVPGTVLSQAMRSVLNWSPDVVLVSQGGIFDVTEVGSAARVVAASDIPYVVICHSEDAVGITDTHRQEAAAFLAKARLVLFVAEATLSAARRLLADPVSNGDVLPGHVARGEAVAWPDATDLLFTCAGRLEVRTKGQDLLLSALGTDLWKSRSWRLTVAGVGPDAEYLRRLTSLLGLSEHVALVGQRPRHDLWRESHVAVLPSRVEALPLTMLEALAAGRPCLVTDVGDCARWVEDGTTGWVAPAASVRMIAAALERAWESRSEHRMMGARARDLALMRSGPPVAASVLSALENATA